MRSTVLKKWCEALRSGEYVQSTPGVERQEYLHERTQHDPIGVLGELCQDATENVNMFRLVDPATNVYAMVNWDALEQWANIDHRAKFGDCKDGEIIYATTILHDQGKPFHMIATFLEVAYAGEIGRSSSAAGGAGVGNQDGEAGESGEDSGTGEDLRGGEHNGTN